jgi:hypothetical protein
MYAKCMDAYRAGHPESLLTWGEKERSTSMALMEIGNNADVPYVGAPGPGGPRYASSLVRGVASLLFALSEYHGCFAEPRLPKPTIEGHDGTGKPSVPGDNGRVIRATAQDGSS